MTIEGIKFIIIITMKYTTSHRCRRLQNYNQPLGLRHIITVFMKAEGVELLISVFYLATTSWILTSSAYNVRILSINFNQNCTRHRGTREMSRK